MAGAFKKTAEKTVYITNRNKMHRAYHNIHIFSVLQRDIYAHIKQTVQRITT